MPRCYATRRRQCGFTLLELLVVLVLVGIILGVAVLSLGDGGRGERIREEATRLAALLELAGEEAVLNTTPYGLALREQGYRFMFHRDGQWQPLEGDTLLKPRSWPVGIEVALFIDGHEVSLEEPESEEEKEPRPALVLYPDGERSPFELELFYTDPPYLRQRVVGNLFGPLERESVTEEGFR
ncbi:MAG: type II secretion system minor pseudopilin GspH [Pseudomonadota bacterium]